MVVHTGTRVSWNGIYEHLNISPAGRDRRRRGGKKGTGGRRKKKRREGRKVIVVANGRGRRGVGEREMQRGETRGGRGGLEKGRERQ